MAFKQGGVAYAYASDPEAGSAYSKRLARKLITRRGKVVLAVALGALVLLFLQPVSYRPRLAEFDNEVSDLDLAEGSWKWNPFKSSTQRIVKVDYAEYIAPIDPDVSTLPKPEDIFPEIVVKEHLKPPVIKAYPSSRMRDIVSPSEEYDPTKDLAAEEQSAVVIPDDSFATQWTGPSDWNGPRGEIRHVQWEGFRGGRDRWETVKQKVEREKRRDAVLRAFVHGWQAYKDHAWGHDEVKPVSKAPSGPFNNWGATIIDSLDTLLIMGLKDEYNLARRHVNELKFNWNNGRDWKDAWVSQANDDGLVVVFPRDRGVGLPVFETTIRYMGGLLGAYDLSGDNLMLERAIDLAEILAKAFNTATGVPAGRIDPGLRFGGFASNRVSIAEAGSMSLEFMRLSQITSNRTWFDFAQRAMDFLAQEIIPRAVHSPLVPLWIDPGSLIKNVDGPLCFGGLADSYYEYLVKTYKLLGGSETAQGWKDVYEKSIDKAKKTIYVDVKTVPGHDILAIGKLERGRLIHEIEHLTCFVGAMLGLGAKLLDRSADMVDAERVTQSCYWLSAATPTGLQPEVVEFFIPSDNETMWDTRNAAGQTPHTIQANELNTHEGSDGVLRWNEDNSPVEGKGSKIYKTKLKGSPPGAKKVVGRGINRPETIESIFYMYRLTGDRKWQDKGWKMFTSWVEMASVQGGFSSIQDVTVAKEKIVFSDNMESFTFAETLKYHYLLQSEPDLISLDDYVLNTEAHPLIANPDLVPGSGGFWHKTPDSDKDLGTRGAGTDVQKWQRFDVLGHATDPTTPKAHGGGGMGGGGGDPNARPKLPPLAQVLEQNRPQ